jgi:hypothetical protein
MDGGQDRVIFVERIGASAAARRVRRIEGELGEKPLSRFVSGRNLLQLGDVGGSQMTVIVQSL